MKIGQSQVNTTSISSGNASTTRQGAANADATAEATRQQQAQRGLQANAKASKAANQMLGTLIDVKA